jgi:holin-like protein
MAMLIAFLTLIGCQLVGELVRAAFALPIPGPVIGMFLLAAVLVIRTRREHTDSSAFDKSLARTAEALISHLGLFFVPAGVGIIAEAGLLRQEWLPIAAALFGSTILGVAVTGLVMHWTARAPERKIERPFRPVSVHQGSRS